MVVFRQTAVANNPPTEKIPLNILANEGKKARERKKNEKYRIYKSLIINN